MRTRHTLMVVMASAALVAGCGDEPDPEPAAQAKPVDLAERRAQLEADPYDVRCSDIRNQSASRITRMVQYALAEDAGVRGLNPLQASTSIWYGMTELCKGKPGSFQPAEKAIAGVKSGRYRAEL